MHNRRRVFALLCGCWVALASAEWARAAEKKGPGKLELGGAEHRLEQFEEKLERMRGQPFKLGYVEREALRRIKALHAKYPDHPKVKEIFERARKAIIASKGETVEIKPGAIAFRENAKKLRQLFAAEADKQFRAYLDKVKAQKNAITKAFPPPDPTKTSVSSMEGRTVVIQGFRYPDNEFRSFGSQYCFVGSGARGYYYVELNNRAWFGAREALRRYCRALGTEVPQEVEWTVFGKIIGVHLLIPQAGKKKTKSAFVGWLVEPGALYVPGYTFAVADAELELGGRFAGEDRVDEIKGPMYSVREVPKDATPERLVAIFGTAIMEKNHTLYLDCIDPNRRKTPTALSRIDYHWDLHQHRFATFYVKVEPQKARTWVVEGYDPESKFDVIFLTPEERRRIAAASKPLVEAAEVKSKAYDERGRQYGSPKPFFLKRLAKTRWYITNYAQPF